MSHVRVTRRRVDRGLSISLVTVRPSERSGRDRSDRRGRLDLSHSGPPGTQPKGLKPWFDFAKRRARDVHIVFGHWASLGLLRRPNLTGLDTGCVWGNHLTAVRLDKPARPIAVSAAAAKRLARRRR